MYPPTAIVQVQVTRSLHTPREPSFAQCPLFALSDGSVDGGFQGEAKGMDVRLRPPRSLERLAHLQCQFSLMSASLVIFFQTPRAAS